MLAAVVLIALGALLVARRSLREVRREVASPAPAPGGRKPGPTEPTAELVGAWVQFLRSEVADAANALNNRLAAIAALTTRIDSGRLKHDDVHLLEQVEVEVRRANGITAGLLRRVDAFAPDTVPETYQYLRDHVDIQADILVVEDDDANREAITHLLQRLGHRVTPARDGMEAWAALEVGQVDCIVCDVVMGGLGGRSFYEQVEQRLPTMASRFVFVTGDYSRPETRAFLEATGCPVIPKPYRVDALLGAVAQALSRVRAGPAPG